VRSIDPAALDFLARRRSIPSRLLEAPGPDEAQQRTLFALATRVPDHGKLAPWRFVRIAGEARRALGEKLVQIQIERDPSTDAAVLDKDRQRFTQAPLVVAVIARITPGHKIPEQEQLLSAGLVAYNLLLAAQALGYGAQWLTGWAAYDAAVASTLGLGVHERVVGFVHIGTAPTEEPPERPRPDPAGLVTDLPP